ncbi:MAG TPA: hypothetical protein DC040_02660 [Deltaproteobacteria bacterium]|nr:hypothetical protein [Deltaproteobacteria bacterium]
MKSNGFKGKKPVNLIIPFHQGTISLLQTIKSNNKPLKQQEKYTQLQAWLYLRFDAQFYFHIF